MEKRRQEEKGIPMDENQKKYAIDDDSLDEVSGGAYYLGNSAAYVIWECAGPAGCGYQWARRSDVTPGGCPECGNPDIRHG